LPPFAALPSEELLPGLLSLEAPPELAASALLLPEEGPLAEAPSALALALLPELLWPAAPLDELLLAEEELPDEDEPGLALPEASWAAAPPLGAAAPLAALDESLLAGEEAPEGDEPALALPELFWAAAPFAELDESLLLAEEEPPAGAPPALALELSELLWPAALPPGLAAAPLAAFGELLLLEALPLAPAAGTVGPWVLLKDLPNPIWEAAAASGARLASAALGAAPASAVLGA
jgi:hypothetical protein